MKMKNAYRLVFLSRMLTKSIAANIFTVIKLKTFLLCLNERLSYLQIFGIIASDHSPSRMQCYINLRFV